MDVQQYIKDWYQHQARTINEIRQVTVNYKSLQPKKGTFYFSDGRHKELVNIQGTIPVKYRGAKYHIPLIIWFMDTHPDNAPICYVTPTPNMKINISHHVDHSGKIYAPYLHEWTPNKSDVITLIQVLTTLFGEHPPLYSVPNAATAAASTPKQNTPSTSATPYPTQQNPYYMPMPGSTVAMPSYPPYPVADTSNTTPPYPLRPAPGPPYNPFSSGYDFNQPMPAASTASSSVPVFRASLLVAAEDKVRRHLKEFVDQAKAELDTLEKIQLELNQGKERLSHLSTKLESEQLEWEKILTTLRDKDAELDAALLNLSNQGELDVDEAVVTTAPLYKQLLKAFAEEAATEDAIYYLGEGLRRGVIDLDVFLKHVRSLSRKQFTLRALMHKCRYKAGLAC